MAKFIDIKALLDFFEQRQCEGAMQMIHFLASPKARGLLEFGSGTIDLEGHLNDLDLDNTDKLGMLQMRTYQFYLGSADGSVMPLESMYELTTFFDQISEEKRKKLDQVFLVMAFMATYEPPEKSALTRQPITTT